MIVFTALAIARFLQEVGGLNVTKTVRALRPLQQITVRVTGHEQLAADSLTVDAQQSLRRSAHHRRHATWQGLSL